MDLTLPGYKYLGPFNKLDKGIPTNLSDAAAFEHDIFYTEYEFLGFDPYLNFNAADQLLLNRLVGQRDYGARVARAFFKLKKLVAPQLENDPLLEIPEKV